MAENAMGTDQNAPAGPKPSGRARTYAIGISPSQQQKMAITVGVHVSPAPLNDCVSTNPYA